MRFFMRLVTFPFNQMNKNQNQNKTLKIDFCDLRKLLSNITTKIKKPNNHLTATLKRKKGDSKLYVIFLLLLLLFVCLVINKV